VIEDVATGASRREAAERYGLSPSVVVIWMQRFEETGSVAAKPSGGSTSPLEEHAEFLLRLMTERPDMTLDEIVAAMRKRRIAGSRRFVGLAARHRSPAVYFSRIFVDAGGLISYGPQQEAA
jgi:transposase